MDGTGFFIKHQWVKAVLYVILGAVGLFALNAAVAASRGYGFLDSGKEAATISVEGEGEVTATPDKATIDFNIESYAGSAKVAQDTLSVVTESVMGALRSHSIADADMKTANYYIEEGCDDYYYYKYTDSTCDSGYTASQRMTVTVKNLADMPAVMRDAVNKGALISSVQFGYADEKGPNNLAQKAAVDDARAKAQAIADSLGVRLGRVVSFENYDDGYSYPTSAYSASSASGAVVPTIPVGDQKVTAQVSVTFEIH